MSDSDDDAPILASALPPAGARSSKRERSSVKSYADDSDEGGSASDEDRPLGKPAKSAKKGKGKGKADSDEDGYSEGMRACSCPRVHAGGCTEGAGRRGRGMCSARAVCLNRAPRITLDAQGDRLDRGDPKQKSQDAGEGQGNAKGRDKIEYRNPGR